MGMTIDEDKCDTCIHAWTDECPLQKCWEHDYKYYEKQAEEKEKMEMTRLTYDVKGKHYCDYSTREIINRLAECEIKLQKIEQITQNTSITDSSNAYAIAFIDIKRVVEDGNDE